MRKIEVVLEKLVKNRNFECKEEWLNSEEFSVYEELRKQGLVRRKKDIRDNVIWYIYSVTTKAEKLYHKVKSR